MKDVPLRLQAASVLAAAQSSTEAAAPAARRGAGSTRVSPDESPSVVRGVIDLDAERSLPSFARAMAGRGDPSWLRLIALRGQTAVGARTSPVMDESVIAGWTGMTCPGSGGNAQTIPVQGLTTVFSPLLLHGRASVAISVDSGGGIGNVATGSATTGSGSTCWEQTGPIDTGGQGVQTTASVHVAQGRCGWTLRGYGTHRAREAPGSGIVQYSSMSLPGPACATQVACGGVGGGPPAEPVIRSAALLTAPFRPRIGDDTCAPGPGGGKGGCYVTESYCWGYDCYVGGVYVFSVVEGCTESTFWVAAQ